MSEMRAALLRQAAANTGDAGAGIILEYTNRVTGGPVMPTIACYMQLLRPVRRRRRAAMSAARTITWSRVPAARWWATSARLGRQGRVHGAKWTFYQHVNSSGRPAFLFSFSDAPVMKALSLYRNETRS